MKVYGIALMVLLFAVGCEMRTSPPPAATFDGEYYSSVHKYAFRITGHTGVATLSNSPKYNVGEVMLKIALVDGRTFQGSQIFTDGVWQSVTGRLQDDGSLLMKGGGFIWTMSRR